MYVTPVWSDVHLNVALVLVVVVVPFVFAGTLAVIVVTAGPSTFHVKVAGVGSKFPASSIARTSSVCWPASGLTSYRLSGAEAHSLHTGGSAPGSSAHSKLDAGLRAGEDEDRGQVDVHLGRRREQDGRVRSAISSSIVHSQVGGHRLGEQVQLVGGDLERVRAAGRAARQREVGLVEGHRRLAERRQAAVQRAERVRIGIVDA